MPEHGFSAGALKIKYLNIAKILFSDFVLHNAVYTFISTYA